MKRYEKMSKEEIMDAYNSSNWCDTCIVRDRCDAAKNGCAGSVDIWLNQEVELVPRFTTIKTYEDLDKVKEDFINAECEKHLLLTVDAFVLYLKEIIPISENC